MSVLAPVPLMEWTTVGATTFGLIFLAEMGDKSQLVCMTLAARHRHLPVLAGSIVAFALLNTLAVLLGAGVAHWLPERILAAVVAVLFGTFGVLALRTAPGCQEAMRGPGRYGVFLTTFLMLVLAEMGDKTQLAVAGMAGVSPPLAVWLGATVALITTSALGVLVGCRLLQRIPIHRMQQGAGVFFLALSGLALTRVF